MEITANAVQSVAVNNNVIFTDTPVSGNCSIIHREGSGLVKLRGLTSTQCRARFKVFFSGNIALDPASGTAPIALAISIDGEPISTSRMIVTPAATEEYFNVSSGLYLDVPAGCCSTIGVTNVAVNPALADPTIILVQNANLIVERVA